MSQAPKTMIYGLYVTLTCPNCGADCLMSNPFAAKDRPWHPDDILLVINETSTKHRTTGCNKQNTETQ